MDSDDQAVWKTGRTLTWKCCNAGPFSVLCCLCLTVWYTLHTYFPALFLLGSRLSVYLKVVLVFLALDSPSGQVTTLNSRRTALAHAPKYIIEQSSAEHGCLVKKCKQSNRRSSISIPRQEVGSQEFVPLSGIVHRLSLLGTSILTTYARHREIQIKQSLHNLRRCRPTAHQLGLAWGSTTSGQKLPPYTSGWPDQRWRRPPPSYPSLDAARCIGRRTGQDKLSKDSRALEMASIFDVPPPPVFTRDGRDGFPPEPEFEIIMAEYIEGLNPRKRDKALMTQAMYDSILIILTNPNDTRCATAQFRFWTKKMFRLVTTAHAQIVTHENRPVAVKEQIYDVLVQCHSQCSHGGRDKTSNQVRRYYSWIPKELIARFVKACPLCNARRTAKSGGNSAGIAALTALGADANLLLANRGLIGDSSSPSDSSTSSDSAVTTPSRQIRLQGMPTGAIVPYTPSSYLGNSMYSIHQMPMSAASTTSSLPPMPSPSHNPQDWTHWVNTTPQRMALSQSIGSSSSDVSTSVQSGGNPTLHFTYHTGEHHQEIQAIDANSTLQTPGQSSLHIATDATQNQIHQPDNETISPLSDSHNQPGPPSAETQAYYSRLMQQTMASFLHAPPMGQQWSSDSVATMSSTTSASTQSSAELADLDDLAINSPLPPLPSASGRDNTQHSGTSIFQQQIDSLTAHLEGVHAQSIEDDEEASFQDFMSSFKQPSGEPDQIDPLLRAMNLDVMHGMPLPYEPVSIMPMPEDCLLVGETTKQHDSPKQTEFRAKKASSTPLGGNTFKFPAVKANLKKSGKKGSQSNSRSADKKKASADETQGGSSSGVHGNQGDNSDEASIGRTNVPIVSTPDLSSYFQLQDTFNQIRHGMTVAALPALRLSTSATPHLGSQAPSPNCPSSEGAHLGQTATTLGQTEFSFNVSDMSGNYDGIAGGSDTSLHSNVDGQTNAGKSRPRPPQLDFSSFSNNNAFSQATQPGKEQDWQIPNDHAFLTASYHFPANEFNQSSAGSVSAPAHITQFTQPEVPLVTPNVPLFSYENMDTSFGFMNNSFAGYNGMGMISQIAAPPAMGSDTSYQYAPGNNMQGLPEQLYDAHRPASAGGFLEPNAYGLSHNTMPQQQQQMPMIGTIHSAPYFHLPMSSQQQQAQARELSEQIQAILDSAVPTNEALVEQATAAVGGGGTRQSRKR